ncbi:MAG: PAS domain S-box protein [Bacteroidales bacterium]|nr:PAS domain S-box protein [Bacteroidales bacterium]
MKDSIKILFVEDVLRDAELNWRELEKGGIVFKKLLVDNRKDFIEGLESFKPDIILSDYSLPQFNGMQALLLRNELAPQTPFIIVTGSVNEEVAVDCMKTGADDYVIKEQLTRLPFAVKEALEQHTILIEKRAAEQLLKENEEKLQSIFSAAPVGIGLVAGKVFIEVNDTFCTMTGYTRKELLGKNAEALYEKDEQDESAGIVIFRHIADKGTGSVETRFKCKDGRVLNIFLSSTPLDTDDLTKGVTFTAMDITERKMMEMELAQKNNALTKLNRFALELSNLSSDSNLVALIADQVKDIACADIAVFSEYDSSTRTTTVKHIAMDSGLLEKVVGLLGKQIQDIHSVVSDEMYREMTTEKIGIKKTLYEASFGAIPRSVGAAIQGLLRVDRIIGIAYLIEGKLYGTSILLMGKDQPDPPREILENFVHLAASSLRRKRAEGALAKLNLKNELILNSAAEGILGLDLQGNHTFVNPAAAKILDYESEELIGRPGHSCWHHSRPDGSPYPQEDCPILNAALNGVEHHESNAMFWRKDGTGFPSEYVSTPILEQGQVTGVVVTFSDITERKLAEDLLIESELKYRSLIENSSDAIFCVDEKGQYRFVNKHFSSIFGKTPEYFDGKTIWDLYDKEFADKRYEFTERLFKFGISESMEVEVPLPDKTLYFWATTNPIRDKTGKVVLNLTHATDITELKKTQIELIKAKEKAEESDRLKSAFLTNISHEIRTPMNGILGFTELLKDTNLSNEDQQDFIQTIQISGARMLNTINSIIDVSKIESGLIKVDIQELDIKEMIEFIYKFFKPEVENKGLKFLFIPGLQHEAIKTDKEKVYAILTNLVKNAIKFTYEGSIEFGYVIKSDRENGSIGQSQSAELEFFVKDTGVGIPQNKKELIFERFRQGSESHNRGYEGSGLGLSISKSYIEMLGGRIWVESEEGRGSTFYFTLPYNPVSEETHTIENVVYTATKEGQIRKPKILIVEDDEISHSILTRMLQNISKEVLHAITGVEAVEACRNNPDLDLILMDIRMPQINGLEATQQIRQFNKDVIIIAQTAYGLSGDREKAIEAGCNDYITKPINQTLLTEIIKRHCTKKSNDKIRGDIPLL